MMKKLAVFIFPGIQTLDLFGPIEMLAGFDDRIALTMVARISGATADPAWSADLS